jgi:hypothetical protein
MFFAFCLFFSVPQVKRRVVPSYNLSWSPLIGFILSWPLVSWSKVSVGRTFSDLVRRGTENRFVQSKFNAMISINMQYEYLFDST